MIETGKTRSRDWAAMPNWQVWTRWMIANIVGAGMGWSAAALVACATLGVGLVAVGLVVGFSLGRTQMQVLRHYGVAESWQTGPFNWLTASGIGGLLGFIVFGGLFLGPTLLFTGLYSNIIVFLFFAFVSGAGAGSSLGWLQSLILRRYIQNAQRWIAYYAVGGGVGSIIGLIFYNAFSAKDNTDPFALISTALLIMISCVLAVIGAGAITGLALFRLKPQLADQNSF